MKAKQRLPRETGMVFDAESVREIAAGRKTATRRVFTPAPWSEVGSFRCLPDGRWEAVWRNGLRALNMAPFQPRYAPGDTLWVKESVWVSTCLNCGELRYVADHPEKPGYMYEKVSSLRMPRVWSRYTLAVEGARIERLQDISDEDIEREGYDKAQELIAMPREWFERRWNQLNAERGFGWNANPWVWALEFRVERT